MSKVLEIGMFASSRMVSGANSRFLPGGYGTEAHGHLHTGHRHEPLRPAPEMKPEAA